jgi:hypothetical protein
MQKTPIGIGKSDNDDDHDAHDDESQRCSKGPYGALSETERSALENELVGVVRETMQPAHASLWLRPETARRGEQAE